MRGSEMFTRRRFLKTAVAAIAVLAAAMGYPTAEAMAEPEISTYRLTPRNWTPGLRLRVAILSDFHAADPWMTIERIRVTCGQANRLMPDIILLLGDYCTAIPHFAREVDPYDWAAALKVLAAPLGVHAIFGNHDYWHDEAFQRDPTVMPVAQKALIRAGIATYVNESVRLEKDGHPFWLAGLGDLLAVKNGIDDLPRTLAQVTDDAPVILLAHEPDIFPLVPSRVSVTLCGHTHGGQINLFGWRPLVPSQYGSRYAAGHVLEGDSEMIISRGLGCTGIPMRFMSSPEIVLLELS
jgi:predicted MPP superfamily phosphohydrolase